MGHRQNHRVAKQQRQRVGALSKIPTIDSYYQLGDMAGQNRMRNGMNFALWGRRTDYQDREIRIQKGRTERTLASPLQGQGQEKKNGYKKKYSFRRQKISSPVLFLPLGFDSHLCHFNCKRIFFGFGICAEQHRTIAHPEDSATAPNSFSTSITRQERQKRQIRRGWRRKVKGRS